jgi:Prokaryotic lipoprotein-attachment site
MIPKIFAMNDETSTTQLSLGRRTAAVHEAGMPWDAARPLQRPMRRGVAILAATFLCIGLVSGCGQKGPLKLPAANMPA